MTSDDLPYDKTYPTLEELEERRAEFTEELKQIDPVERTRAHGRERQRRRREKILTEQQRAEERKKQREYDTRYRQKHRRERALRSYEQRVRAYIDRYGREAYDKHYIHRSGVHLRPDTRPVV